MTHAEPQTPHSPFPSFQLSYGSLPPTLFTQVEPYGASAPELIRLNTSFAQKLGFHLDGLTNKDIAAIFSGNWRADGSKPLAMAYAGHQFGGFNPGLGDGRAMLLGEVLDSLGTRFDVQLKGSGQTPYSRQGDGRAALGPVLREYVISEAMAALGVPTTRALAAITTGDRVLREQILPGAMVTRVARSHLRVGTFEYAAFRTDRETLACLVDYALERHGPHTLNDESPALALLRAVIKRQADLVAHWISLGFIHGVMNTDNCTISGETIDYGPCAFMDWYDPHQVYSSIDTEGRYAFSNQPAVAHWNMAVLAQSLLPLITDDQDTAVETAQEAVSSFPSVFQDAYMGRMRRKLGLTTNHDDDSALLRDLLSAMAEESADFTTTFRALGEALSQTPETLTFLARADDGWLNRWRKRLSQEPHSPTDTKALMHGVNPAIIPRNHRVEAMIASAMEGDFKPFHAMINELAKPYDDAPLTGEGAQLAKPPTSGEIVHATYCGT
ncbi:MAG: YdiU family protein [Pseudomonadota bacterium]